MFVLLEGTSWGEIVFLLMMTRFAVQQANTFVQQKTFPDTNNIMDSLYMPVLDQLVKELCKVG